jgi:hypothetical protein
MRNQPWKHGTQWRERMPGNEETKYVALVSNHRVICLVFTHEKAMRGQQSQRVEHNKQFHKVYRAKMRS